MPSTSNTKSSRITAALGPTNTGKTHQAVTRMLEHPSGMIGLPLRLLAREIYDRVTAQIGEGQVALVTGEEKRIPPRPRYWICTTEAMPTDREVDFVAVDEIQLAAHPQRGHVFTDRMLHSRGRSETWLMGADTMRPLVEQLVPTAEIKRRPRFSSLSSAGRLALQALPPRSAVVAFSATQVYELAERVRRKRGGTAVVLGALSPRTRNAQVAMYQSGEVQYLVATDAIGMGLNLDVDLVAFAGLRKFDGHTDRALDPAELAQIAGRAGRHLNDGSFATLAPMPPLSDDVVFALENHQFPVIRRIVWRNSDLDLSSVDALLASLRQKPRLGCLRLVDRAEDYDALVQLVAMPEVRTRAQDPERVELLWTVCQIPDFRQLLMESHVRLLAELFLQLSGPRAAIHTDWMASRIQRIDDVNGDIDTLMTRIAFIRTWTYVANHTQWVANPAHWQEVTRAIEDRLSDALHDRLVQRFVARGHAPVAVRSRSRTRRAVETPDEPKRSEGPFSALAGLRVAGARGAVDLTPVEDWVGDLVDAPHAAFALDMHGRIHHGDEPIGRLSRGVDLLRPHVTLTVDDELGAGDRLRLERRLLAFARDTVEQLLAPLRSEGAQTLSPSGRGLVYLLEQRLGTLRTQGAREQLAGLVESDRRWLRRNRVKMGARVVYVLPRLSCAWVRIRIALCAAFLRTKVPAELPLVGEPSCRVDPSLDETLYLAIGYPVFGPRAVRADVVERAHHELARSAKAGAFALPSDLPGVLGCDEREARGVVAALGYRAVDDGKFTREKRSREQRRRPSRGA